MKKFLCLFLLLCTAAALAQKIQSAPLLSLRMARQGFENTIWMQQRAKIGDESVVGYIQGVGGADDALMGFELQQEWDLMEVTIGYLATTPEGRTAEFSVEGGGQVLFESGVLHSKKPGHRVKVPIKGHKRIMLRITSDQYNGTAGAAWGAPTLYSGVPASELEPTWSLEVNGQRTPLSGQSSPREVLIPFDVPGAEETEYRVRLRRDPAGKLVVVEKEPLEP